MAYRLDDTDIVIDGWEKGIADSPYSGIGDIRNLDLTSVPQEASVLFATANTVTQTSLQAQAFTASSSGGILFTWAGGTALANNTALTFVTTGSLPTNILVNVAYYVINTTATTFNVSLTAGGTAVAFSAAGSNSTFSTIDMAKPKNTAVTPSRNISDNSLLYLYFLNDANGRVWYYYNTTQWIYLNNLTTSSGSESVSINTRGNGMAILAGYLFNFGNINIYYVSVLDSGYVARSIAYLTLSSNWPAAWKSMLYANGASGTYSWANTAPPLDVSHQAVSSVGQSNIYFCSINSLGSILATPGTIFNPTDPTTYTFNGAALALPTYEVAQSVAVLGNNSYVGGTRNVVYAWDGKSIGYSPIYISENGVAQILAVNSTIYIFAGQRGRIYICNGTNAQLYKKIPDHISNTINPYFTWGGVVASRNQIYFGIQATDNAGVAINNYGGLWAIDMETNALRLVNQLSYGTYAGNLTALIALLGPTTSDGFGLLMGWFTTIGGVDKGTSAPYTGSQAYIDSDIIPAGTFLGKKTYSGIEFKLATPLVSGESVTLSYRTNLTSAYTQIGTTNTVGIISDFYTMNFDQVQWIQIRAQLTSTATTPSYVRLREIRIK